MYSKDLVLLPNQNQHLVQWKPLFAQAVGVLESRDVTCVQVKDIRDGLALVNLSHVGRVVELGR
jgi:hypothetical protein